MSAPPLGRRAVLERAIVELHAGRLAAADELLSVTLNDDPDDHDTLHLAGILRHEQRASAEAAQFIRAAIARWPAGDAALIGVWNNLGNVLLESGSLTDAADAYRAGLALDPDAAHTWGNLAVLYRRMHRLDDAVAAAREAVRIEPESANGWFTLSRMLIESGEVPEGLRANAEAVARAPKDAFGREQVLRSLVLLGRRAEAAELYREWLRDDPDDPVARHQLAACEEGAPPARASDAYVETVFDQFAQSFDAKLATLDYRAPSLVVGALTAALRDRDVAGAVADLGCGTGLVGVQLRGPVGPRVDRLVGVDLSVGMLQRAARRGVYDVLFKVELVEFLRHEVGRFDSVVSADTLCYAGGLAEFADAAVAALRPGGVLAFTTEALTDDASEPDWMLTPTGRYAHRPAYLDRVLRGAGASSVDVRLDVLRMEAGEPVAGAVVTARAPG